MVADGSGLRPGRDCPRCPRLAAFRTEARGREPSWHNAPVPAFGDLDAPLLICGLAPGLRGANRTGRPFTGDGAGELLYATLHAIGLARGTYEARADDDFRLEGCRVTNAVRCVPPENKPIGAEVAACNAFLAAEIAAMPRLKAILALGAVSHGAVLRALGAKLRAAPFAHGAAATLRPGLTLVSSYHCSRYNTNTGVLTQPMFHAAVAQAARAAGFDVGARRWA